MPGRDALRGAVYVRGANVRGSPGGADGAAVRMAAVLSLASAGADAGSDSSSDSDGTVQSGDRGSDDQNRQLVAAGAADQPTGQQPRIAAAEDLQDVRLQQQLQQQQRQRQQQQQQQQQQHPDQTDPHAFDYTDEMRPYPPPARTALTALLLVSPRTQASREAAEERVLARRAMQPSDREQALEVCVLSAASAALVVQP